MIVGKSILQTIADSPRQMPKLFSYGLGSRLKLEGIEPYSLYADVEEDSEKGADASVPELNVKGSPPSERHQN